METQVESSSNQKIQRTVIIEWVTILTAFFACFGILYSEIKGLDSKLEKQGARTDRLYEMFIDLVKETKCPPSNTKLTLLYD